MTETSAASWPTQQEAARAANGAERAFYIVVPASPWGGKTGTFGPMTLAEAREKLAAFLPAYVPECPPKLLELIEDYAPAAPDSTEGEQP